MQPLRWLLWFAGRVVLGLRYKYKVIGLEGATKHPGPYLVLPNHPAYIDPLLAFTSLWRTLQPRPLLFEGISTPYKHPRRTTAEPKVADRVPAAQGNRKRVIGAPYLRHHGGEPAADGLVLGWVGALRPMEDD